MPPIKCELVFINDNETTRRDKDIKLLRSRRIGGEILRVAYARLNSKRKRESEEKQREKLEEGEHEIARVTWEARGIREKGQWIARESLLLAI